MLSSNELKYIKYDADLITKLKEDGKMSCDKVVGSITNGTIIVIDGKYYREITYRKKNKMVTKNIPIEDIFADFIGRKIKIRVDVIEEGN